jgi:hypothetical protein
MFLSAPRLSAESARRIRNALIETLLQERAYSENAEPVLSGPWNLLIDDCCTWRQAPRLDQQLYRRLRGHFSNNVTREILLAAAGVKVSRTCLPDAKIELLRDIAEAQGFAVTASSEKYIHRRDLGKGGSSNSIERLAGPEEEDGLRNVYIAADAGLANAGEMLDEAGDDENFGLLLGIPPCCREAYMRTSPIASARQNDFVLLALDNTAGMMPYDFWLNYPANYFGPGLLSFFPCSFRCESAAAVARSTFEMLNYCDEDWARSFVTFQQTNILYTEYEGLHMFLRPLVDGSIRYGPGDYRSTEPGRVSDLISKGSRLEVRGKHEILIYHESEQIAAIDGLDVGMCAFRLE